MVDIHRSTSTMHPMVALLLAAGSASVSPEPLVGEVVSTAGAGQSRRSGGTHPEHSGEPVHAPASHAPMVVPHHSLSDPR